VEYIRATIQDWPDAQAHSKTRCAIALSIKRSDPTVEFVRVDHDEIRVSFKDNDLRYRFRTPARAKRTITQNDNHLPTRSWELVMNHEDFLFEPAPRRHHETKGNGDRPPRAHVARPDRPRSYRQ
jgi:hypothetical protein